MAQISIRDDILLALSAFAKAKGAAVETIAEEFIKTSLEHQGSHKTMKSQKSYDLPTKKEWQKKRDQIKKISTMTPKNITQTDSVILLREERDDK